MSALASEPRLTATEWTAMLHAGVLDQRHLDTALGPDLAAYLTWARVEAGKRPRTLDQYERDLARGALLYPSLARADWRKEHIRAVLASFPEGSRPRVWSAHSDFWRWQYDENRVDESPMRGIRRPKQPPTKVLDIFSDAERARLVEAQRNSLLPLVDRCRVLILQDTGLRKSEARLLQVHDVNHIDRYLIVRNAKGGDERIVAFGEDVQRAFLDFLYAPLPKLDRPPEPDDYIWFPARATGVYGTREAQLLRLDPERPMSSTAMHNWWVKTVERAGKVRYRKLHTTRHSYATDLLDATGDVVSVQEALGHRSLKATEVYIHNQRTRGRKSAEALEAFRKVVPIGEGKSVATKR